MPTAALRLPIGRLPKLDREHWLGSAVLAVAAALYLVAGLSVTSIAGGPGGAAANARVGPIAAADIVSQPAPEPEPLQFKPVDPADAVSFNASIPVSTSPNPAARPFVLRAASEADRLRSLACLTAAVYYEAATEPADGQRAVAQVVLNRVRHPAYPDTVCGVVFQGAERATGCQFTFTCDGSIARAPSAAYWARARSVAEAALAGGVYAPVGWATHYHTNWVVPYWSSSLVKAANVGTHIFFRWEGGWGRAPAFAKRHRGAEPVLPKMAYLGFGSLPAETLTAEQQAILDAGALATAVSPGEAPAASAGGYDPGALNRAIVRRFRPATRDGVAETLSRQTAPGQTVDDSTRWALTGAGGSGSAFGKKAAPAPLPATPPAATP